MIEGNIKKIVLNTDDSHLIKEIDITSERNRKKRTLKFLGIVFLILLLIIFCKTIMK